MPPRAPTRVATPSRRETPGEIVARLAVFAAIFSWLGVFLALFWR